MDNQPFIIKPKKQIVIKRVLASPTYSKLLYAIKKRPTSSFYCCGKVIKATSMQAHLKSKAHLYKTVLNSI